MGWGAISNVVINGVVSINGKQGATNTALIVTDATNATLKIGFPSSGNVGFGGNQGHHLNFGYFLQMQIHHIHHK